MTYEEVRDAAVLEWRDGEQSCPQDAVFEAGFRAGFNAGIRIAARIARDSYLPPNLGLHPRHVESANARSSHIAKAIEALEVPA